VSRLLSIPEFGRVISVSRSTAYELVARGEVRTVAIGARRLVPVVEVDRYVDRLLAEAGIEQEVSDATSR
jgi:excisionase family DNA binding protein